jgi:hypothetical protein
MRQLGIGIHNFHDTRKKLPEGINYTYPYQYWSWMAQILPYIEQNNAYQQADTWARTPTSPDQYRWWPWGDFWDSPQTPANPTMGLLLPTVICPADTRTEFLLPGSSWGGIGNVAFTAYVGVASSAEGDETYNGGQSNGSFYWTSKLTLANITDGTSNTFFVGERPPSADLYYGWWFAGAGWDGSGEGDVVLGARSYNYASSLGCSSSYVGFQPGNVKNSCDQVHFWSQHIGGGNFLSGDASVRFTSYGANVILPQLCSRDGGEVADASAY